MCETESADWQGLLLCNPPDRRVVISDAHCADRRAKESHSAVRRSAWPDDNAQSVFQGGVAMFPSSSRRQFLQKAAGGALLGLTDLQFLGDLPGVSLAQAQAKPDVVRLRPEIEPLVRFLEETPREKLI